MRFYKFISVLLHPIVIPTIGILLFLLLTPNTITIQRQYLLISIVFIATYLIPLITLIILKSLGLISSFKVHSINERKIPMILMLVVFFVLGRLLYGISDFKKLGILFYATDLALLCIYLLFIIKIKTSLHVMSMSCLIGFILFYSSRHQIATLPIVAILIVLTGLLSSARLHLKAHKHQEIYLGFFLGIASQAILFYFL